MVLSFFSFHLESNRIYTPFTTKHAILFYFIILIIEKISQALHWLSEVINLIQFYHFSSINILSSIVTNYYYI